MKKGFVVYFDNCRQIARLPDEQYAAVWRVVTEYAERVAMGDLAEDWLEVQLAVMPPEAEMAAKFMADTIRRDDRRYQEKTAQYRAAQGKGQQTGGGSIDPEMAKYVRNPARDQKRKESEDNIWHYVDKV